MEHIIEWVVGGGSVEKEEEEKIEKFDIKFQYDFIHF